MSSPEKKEMSFYPTMKLLIHRDTCIGLHSVLSYDLQCQHFERSCDVFLMDNIRGDVDLSL